MPLFEYECRTCQRREEKLHKTSDPIWQCPPMCCNVPMHRVMSAPAVHFKGTGFYQTDYKGKP